MRRQVPHAAMAERIEPYRGIYDADRASALSGVPRSTLHYWARREVLIPEVASEPRTRLWSWGDLVVLRLIHWLRREKPDLHRSPMGDVRGLVMELRDASFTLGELHDMVAVSSGGRVLVRTNASEFVLVSGHQAVLPGTLQLVRPYESGPDLLIPSASLRILPGKLSGQPHIRGSRVPTAGLWALYQRGYVVEQLLELYPELSIESVVEAIELERKLHAA